MENSGYRIKAALLCFASAGTLLGSSLTVGSDNGANTFPFGGPVFGNPGTEYQEAYASSNFAGPTLISGIDFFQAGSGDLYAGTYTLSLSVISNSIDTLSSTDLASNFGPDNTVFDTVFLSGAAPGELSFTGTPFLYDPSQGNLLLNISIAGGTPGSGPAAAFEENGGLGDNLARYQNFGSANGLGWGLVTEFDSASSAVPEPGMLAVLCCGLVGMVLGRFRHSRN